MTSRRLPVDRRHWPAWFAARFAAIHSVRRRLDLDRFADLTAGLPPDERVLALSYLPPALEHQAWTALRDEIDAERWGATVIPFPSSDRRAA